MIRDFTYAGRPAHIVFGEGAQVGHGSTSSAAAARWCFRRPHQAAEAKTLAARLGGTRCRRLHRRRHAHAGRGDRGGLAAARERGADCVVSLGGGSTTGLGKAIALRTDLPQIVVPTTYAGSEVTDDPRPDRGRREDHAARSEGAARSRHLRRELTLGLPPALSVTSGLNAMAHAAEALYADDRNPIITLMAVEGDRARWRKRCPASSRHRATSTRGRGALYGAWLCGSVLGAVAMALHHKLCHTLGGSFDTPHAETHAIAAAAYDRASMPWRCPTCSRRSPHLRRRRRARPVRFRHVARRADGAPRSRPERSRSRPRRRRSRPRTRTPIRARSTAAASARCFRMPGRARGRDT